MSEPDTLTLVLKLETGADIDAIIRNIEKMPVCKVTDRADGDLIKTVHNIESALGESSSNILLRLSEVGDTTQNSALNDLPHGASRVKRIFLHTNKAVDAVMDAIEAIGSVVIVIALLALYFYTIWWSVNHGMAYVLAATWLMASVLTAKLDAAMVGDPTSRSNIALSFVAWPVISVLLITTKHHCNNGTQNHWAR